MPTTIYDSSLLTKRIQNKTIANSFIRRIQNETNPTTGSAPILGITEQSIINSVKTGQMTDYRKNDGGCVTINKGCPCPEVNTPLIEAIRGWATSIGGISADAVDSIATDSFGNVYVTGYYASNSLTINNFVTDPVTPGTQITVTPYGTLTNTGSFDVFIVKYNTNGQAQWATSIGGTFDDQVRSIATDSFGNVYVTGYFRSNPLTINNFVSAGTPITLTPYGTLLNNSGSDDVFIVKYNTNGQAQWATSIVGTNNERGNSIATDSSGNVYVTGQYASDPLTINNFVSAGTPITLTPYGTLTNTVSFDVFIVKYNTNGQAQWATSIGGSSSDLGRSIATDSSGNVYVSGSYASNPLTINNFVSTGTPITVTPYGSLNNSGSDDVFIVKYNTNGQAQWATSIEGSSSDVGNSVSTDSFGNIYVTGQYSSNPLTINNFVSAGTPITLTPYGTLTNTVSVDVFIVKYNTNGQAQWATSIGGSIFDVGNSISTDSFGNIYVTGQYSSNPLTINNFVSAGTPITLTPYGTLTNTVSVDVFIVKYNTNGQAQWATSIGGSSSDVGRSIATDSSGNVYVTGYFRSNPLTINNFVSAGTPITVTPYGSLNNSGSDDVFIVKYNTNGQVL